MPDGFRVGLFIGRKKQAGVREVFFMNKYPMLILDAAKLKNNASETVKRCREKGVSVCGVIKGCDGDLDVARIMVDSGVSQLGSSRLYHLSELKRVGCKLPLMLIRTPAPSEAYETVKYSDISLNTEKETLILLNKACKEQYKTHSVVIMAELGDLREGVWDKKELCDLCLFVEKELPYLKLSGIGTNMGCYGSVVPTVAKMKELLSLARDVESVIGRKLELISGGATNAFPLVCSGQMPEGVNHLRIGENVLTARDLRNYSVWKALIFFLSICLPCARKYPN